MSATARSPARPAERGRRTARSPATDPWNTPTRTPRPRPRPSRTCCAAGYARHNLAAPDDGTLRIPLPTSGTALLAPVRYWSPTGWHRFGLPHLADAPADAPAADAVTVATLLAREAYDAASLTPAR